MSSVKFNNNKRSVNDAAISSDSDSDDDFGPKPATCNADNRSNVADETTTKKKVIKRRKLLNEKVIIENYILALLRYPCILTLIYC